MLPSALGTAAVLSDVTPVIRPLGSILSIMNKGSAAVDLYRQLNPTFIEKAALTICSLSPEGLGRLPVKES